MPNLTATELFGNWVDLGKDEGMEIGHNSSVEFMISKALERLSGKFTCIDLGCGNGWTVRKIAKLSNCSESSGVDGSNRMITMYTGKTPIENVKEITLNHEKNIKKQTLESEDFYFLVKNKKFVFFNNNIDTRCYHI